jgi:hypothetical protein
MPDKRHYLAIRSDAEDQVNMVTQHRPLVNMHIPPLGGLRERSCHKLRRMASEKRLAISGMPRDVKEDPKGPVCHFSSADPGAVPRGERA